MKEPKKMSKKVHNQLKEIHLDEIMDYHTHAWFIDRKHYYMRELRYRHEDAFRLAYNDYLNKDR